MKVAAVVDTMEAIAPLRLAAVWDRVGLLVGSRAWDVQRLMLTIDLTEAVLDEAVDGSVDAIIAYHPPIFEPLAALTDEEPRSRVILNAAREGIAVYSPHTALDAADGGVNDWLAAGLGPGDVRSLELFENLPASEENKVVTFCPREAVDRLRQALASVGAGRIGDYELCSFEIEGTGTFFGGESTTPAVGKKGELERVDEVRLEMVCPTRSLALAVTTIRQFHPYEEPPIEIYPLRARPERRFGQGRRVVLDRAVTIRTIVDRIRQTIGNRRILVAEADDPPPRYTTIGVCAGAGGSLLDAAVREGCQIFFTGEMRHHDVLAANARGCTVVLAGHTNTERGYLKILRRRLADQLSGLPIVISKRDRDPLKPM